MPAPRVVSRQFLSYSFQKQRSVVPGREPTCRAGNCDLSGGYAAGIAEEMSVMIGILINAVLLLVLLKLINNDDRDLVIAIVVAIAIATGTPILAFLMIIATGDGGELADFDLLIAVTAAMTLLAGIVMLLFGVELKKSALVAVLFTGIQFGVAFGLGMLPVA
jgi:hypothetical protein